MASALSAQPSKCKALVHANEHRNAYTQVTLSSNINPGSSCLIYAEVAPARRTPTEREQRGQKARLSRPARWSRAEGRELRREERAAQTGRKPRREEGRELARAPSPRRRRGLLTSAALLPSPPNTLSSRPDPPSSHHVSSPLPPEGPRALEAGETERMAL